MSTRRWRDLAPLGFTLPALGWFLVFTVGPLVSLFYFALTDWRGLIAPRTFVGLGNFTRLAGDPVFHHAVRNSLVQLVVTLPVVIAGAFMIAYYLSLKPRGHRFIRAVLFTPVLLSAPALAMVFVGVFAPSGLVNGLLKGIGLDAAVRPWLAAESTASIAILAVIVWSSMSVSAVMLAARLNNVPAELFEAAGLDGCGHWRRMWTIAWPICRDYVGVVTMLQFLWTLFSSAAVVLLLTRGGPGTSTVNLSFLVYDYAFNQSKVGYSQAIAVMLFVVGVLGLLGIRRLFRQNY
ncbi:carbohydrate ABC transporter permease [Nonomuraea soli]|uniref:Multiple sugar transport system permease protein n=1 Tax=Nonomuraea soli TaxID=1032476 RepID=A0A7W0CRZ7_9ACTN|nr:sugar ABC transporter permease [Nonomuraea soli]MBA2896190.1 multiple sugar transport system permease protein [Nonomuraea soli]